MPTIECCAGHGAAHGPQIGTAPQRERSFEERSVSRETVAHKTPFCDNCHGFRAPAVQASCHNPVQRRHQESSLLSEEKTCFPQHFLRNTHSASSRNHAVSLPSKSRVGCVPYKNEARTCLTASPAIKKRDMRKIHTAPQRESMLATRRSPCETFASKATFAHPDAYAKSLFQKLELDPWKRGSSFGLWVCSSTLQVHG